MSKKKKLLIIAGIIIALLAIAGGILMYLYCKMWYDYGEMNRREYNEAREKSPDYLALGVHKYSYPDDEFVLTENLQGVIEYSIAQDIDFTDCTPEQWQDDFIKYYLNSDYIGPEYKANLLEENDNKVSKEEAEYIQFSLTGEYFRFKNVDDEIDCNDNPYSPQAFASIIDYTFESEGEDIILTAHVRKGRKSSSESINRVYDINLIKRPYSCFDGYSIDEIKETDLEYSDVFSENNSLDDFASVLNSSEKFYCYDFCDDWITIDEFLAEFEVDGISFDEYCILDIDGLNGKDLVLSVDGAGGHYLILSKINDMFYGVYRSCREFQMLQNSGMFMGAGGAGDWYYHTIEIYENGYTDNEVARHVYRTNDDTGEEELECMVGPVDVTEDEFNHWLDSNFSDEVEWLEFDWDLIK